MTVYAMWYGGYSYSYGEIPEDLEVFPSIRAAGEALRARYESNGWRTAPVHYADGRQALTLFPAVDTTCSMDIYRYDPRTAHEPYPDLRLTLGPRLGIRKEKCW